MHKQLRKRTALCDKTTCVEPLICLHHAPTLLRNVMVKTLHFGVVPQQVQTLAIRLPQEFDPWREQQAVGTVLSVLPTHSAQQYTGQMQFVCYSLTHYFFFSRSGSLKFPTNQRCHAPLRGLNVIQIFDVQHHLLGLLFGRLGLLLCKFQVGANHIFQRLDIHLRSKAISFKSGNQLVEGLTS